ncbi:MAG: MgtC/SapB family protein [Dehalococcoidales bacterium]|nr:MgtC/SapB family protein [Dehalococcoidales bacterium]
MPPIVEMSLRLVAAAVLGAAIGFQREKAKRPAGLRTNALIALGAALFTISGVFAFPDDQARVAAGIVTGIGFLGAGAILHKDGGIVAGLTTAASIWTVAGIGMAVGAGQYVLALVTTALTIIILSLPHAFR